MFEPVNLGRYECYERVGMTAYGELLRARVTGAAVETHFLVRRLVGAARDDTGARRRFVLAATALMPIEDPRLVTVVEARDVPGGDCFVAMEDVNGADLGRVMTAAGRLSEDAAAYVAREVARALAVLSARKCVHGAVVPSNVTITVEGDVKLADAGLRIAITGEAAEAEVDGQALVQLVTMMLGGPPKRVELVEALRGDAPTEEALQAAGDCNRGRTELALAARRAVDQMKPAPAAKPKSGEHVSGPVAAPMSAVRMDIPTNTGRVVRVPISPLWMKLGVLVAIAGIGVAVWRMMSHRKTTVAIAAAPEPDVKPTAPPQPPPPTPPAPPVEPAPKPVVAAPEPAPQPVPLMEPDPQPKQARHTPDPGGLRVRCHTRGLRIYVDGRDSRVTCPVDYRHISAAPGDHTIALVRKSGGAPVAQKTVRVRPQSRSIRVYFHD